MAPSNCKPPRSTGLFGLTDGSFFTAPPHVDLSRPPGTASLKDCYIKDNHWVWDTLTLQFFFFRPHLVWFLITVFVYILFPYDLQAASQWSLNWVLTRTLLHVGLVLVYFSFWYMALYHWNWARRKFKPDNRPTPGRMLHNITYTLLGAIQMAMWEVVFMHMWATGKLPYISDAALLASPLALAWTAFLVIAIPVFRDFHFYFAHRFLHLRFFYKFVHSLHHRNTDIEPFSGMCMHPVEHLYYFSSVLPSIYLPCSPLIFLWGALHLTLSPAASHSGWEDHWQGDLFHYLHHSKFECNYGTSGVPLDHWFGTFRDCLKAPDTAAQQQQQQQQQQPALHRKGGWSLSNALPTLPSALYTAASAALFVFFGVAAVRPTSLSPTLVGLPTWLAASLGMAVGPIVLAYVMWLGSGEKFSVFWPFHKERLVGAFGFHALCGVVFAVLPVFHIAASLLGPTSTYCTLWSC